MLDGALRDQSRLLWQVGDQAGRGARPGLLRRLRCRKHLGSPRNSGSRATRRTDRKNVQVAAAMFGKRCRKPRYRPRTDRVVECPTSSGCSPVRRIAMPWRNLWRPNATSPIARRASRGRTRRDSEPAEAERLWCIRFEPTGNSLRRHWRSIVEQHVGLFQPIGEFFRLLSQRVGLRASTRCLDGLPNADRRAEHQRHDHDRRRRERNRSRARACRTDRRAKADEPRSAVPSETAVHRPPIPQPWHNAAAVLLERLHRDPIQVAAQHR